MADDILMHCGNSVNMSMKRACDSFFDILTREICVEIPASECVQASLECGIFFRRGLILL